jgi:hypothetical protein
MTKASRLQELSNGSMPAAAAFFWASERGAMVRDVVFAHFAVQRGRF